jgi:hypothetical protein
MVFSGVFIRILQFAACSFDCMMQIAALTNDTTGRFLIILCHKLPEKYGKL